MFVMLVTYFVIITRVLINSHMKTQIFLLIMMMMVIIMMMMIIIIIILLMEM